MVQNANLINTNIKVSHFINNSRNWDTNKIDTELQNIINPNILEKIKETIIPKNELQDKLYWRCSKNGWFSTKSASDMIEDESILQPNKACEWIWKLDTQPKIKNFIWKMSINGIPTKAKLDERKIVVTRHCELCNHHLEDLTHLIIECPITKQIIAKFDRTILNDINKIRIQNKKKSS